MSYRPHKAFVDPAKATREVWRLGLGVVLIGAVTLASSQIFYLILQTVLGTDRAWSVMTDIQSGDSAFGALVLLVSLGALGAGAVLTVRTLHNRGFRSMVGPLPLAWQQFLRVLALVGGVHIVVGLLPPYDLYGDITPGLSTVSWVLVLPLSIVALLIQTGSEELVFRGYVQQQLAARFANPVVWLTLPQALFALGHYVPDVYGTNAWMVVLWSFCFGLAMADLTARAGSLGPAVAVHFVNNAWAILLLAPKGDLSGLALYTLPFGPEDEAAMAALLPGELAMIGVSWLAARVALRR